MIPSRSRPGGMRGFSVVWFGQLISLLGTGMSNFAISIWIFQETGEASALTWAIFFFFAPVVFASPIAGAIVDRSNRKTIMILTDLAAGLVTIGWLVLLATDGLQIWHIYAGNFVSGLFNSFQFPAYSAAVTLMLPKEQYARANGMISLAGSASNILAPAFAAALLGPIGLVGLLLFDVLTFIVAIGALIVVYIPQPDFSAGERTGQGSLLQESLFGFRYILERPSLLGLQLVFFTLNALLSFGTALMIPMILARSGNNEAALASVQSAGAVGGVVGALLLTAWGGPKRRIHGVLIGMVLGSLLGNILLGIGQAILIWTAAAFLGQFFIPMVNGSNQAIWQAKVVPDVQGRVFAVRRLIAQVTAPIAIALAGPLADNVFEPAMMAGGSLSNAFGWLVGIGPGAGMGLMFVATGFVGAIAGLSGYIFPAIREAEKRLPDYDAASSEPLELAAAESAA